MDEEDLDEEDLDEEDLDIGTEIDPDSPPWDMYGEPDIDDIDDSNEDTALLRTKTPRTEIIVTPISPVISFTSCHRQWFVVSSSLFSFFLMLSGEFVPWLGEIGPHHEQQRQDQDQRNPNGFTQTWRAAATYASVGRHLRFSKNL